MQTKVKVAKITQENNIIVHKIQRLKSDLFM